MLVHTFRRSISIDGSSTVYPIATALVEAFNDENPGVKITAGQKGTGGGIKDFANKSIDIADASRPIKESEIADCKKNGVEWQRADSIINKTPLARETNAFISGRAPSAYVPALAKSFHPHRRAPPAAPRT